MILRLAIAALVSLLCLLPAGVAVEKPVKVVISGSYRGRVDGCRCPGKVTGGLGRHAEMMSEIFPGQAPVGLDCGAILDLDWEGGELRSRCAIHGMARLGLKVIGVVPRDLFYGVDFLRSIADSAHITLVSANLIAASTNQLLFKPWTTISIENTNLFVTSLANYQPDRRYNIPVGWTRCSPDSVIGELIASIPPEIDYTVLLTDMSENDLRCFLTDYTVFDLALTSSRLVYTESPFKVCNTYVANPEADGRFISWIELEDEKPVKFQKVPLHNKARQNPVIMKWLEECLGRDVLQK